MLSGRIEGCTRVLGSPEDYEKRTGVKCVSLAIADTRVGNINMMVSAWFPNTEEIEAIRAGAPVYLWVQGETHPPVAVTTGAPPSEDDIT